MARKNTEKLKANLALLKERFPNVFYDTKPLIPTIADEMLLELGDDPLAQIVRPTMRYYMNTPKYLRHLANRKWIRNVWGSKVRLITEEEKQHAKKRLELIRQQHSQEYAEYRFALALAKETNIDFQRAQLLEQPNKNSGKVLVITRKSKKVIDDKN